ncbi:MAG: hypothetical protein MUE69_21230 [Myxococcota bacterium]|nr:hypothetical protein [Myxococcota bacterium]
MSVELVRPTAEGPRFDLRFERGRVHLSLGRPLGIDGVTIEHLVIALDFRGPVDLRGGAKRFRHHRGRVIELRLRVRPARLASWIDEGRTLRADDHARPSREDTSLRAAYRDEAGVLAFDVGLAFDGVDLVASPRELAWVRGSPRTAWERWAKLAERMGGRADASSGVLRIERPIRALLAEVLLPHGWRVPDERGCGARLAASADVVVVEVGERLVGPRPTLLDGAVFDAAEPSGDAGALRACLDAADLDGARAAQRRLGGWLAGEGALAIAERFEHALSPDALIELLVLGLSSFPEDERAWRRWIARLSDRGAVGALRLADVALAGPLPRSSRAELAVSAAMGVLDAFADPDVDDEDPVVERRLQRIVQDAAALAPESARVLAARAALAHRSGQLAEAARLWDRAAESVAADDHAIAAEWRRRAAQLLFGIEGPAAAEPLLRRALADAGDAPDVLCDLAAVLVERGDVVAAEELYARLLRPDARRGAERRAALLVAARHHLVRGAADRARPFLAELGDDPASLELHEREATDTPSVAHPSSTRPSSTASSTPPSRARHDEPWESDADGERSMVLFSPPETSQVLSPSGSALLDEDDDDSFDADSFEGGLDEDELDPAALDRLFDESSEAPKPRHLRSVDALERDDERAERGDAPIEALDPLEALVLAPGEEGGDAGHLDSWLPRIGARPPVRLPPEPPLPKSLPSLPKSSPPVTLVSVADDELRALLEAVAEADDPGALLEGALEEALTDADAAGVRRVLRVLQRVDDFAGAAALAARARRLLERLDEEP